MTIDNWQLTIDNWQLTIDNWQLTIDNWQLTIDACLEDTMWRHLVTPRMWVETLHCARCGRRIVPYPPMASGLSRRNYVRFCEGLQSAEQSSIELSIYCAQLWRKCLVARVIVWLRQCRINNGANGAAAPGPPPQLGAPHKGFFFCTLIFLHTRSQTGLQRPPPPPPRPTAVLHAAFGSVGLGHRGSHSPREKPPTKVLHQAPHIGNPALVSSHCLALYGLCNGNPKNVRITARQTLADQCRAKGPRLVTINKSPKWAAPHLLPSWALHSGALTTGQHWSGPYRPPSCSSPQIKNISLCVSIWFDIQK